MNTNYYIVGSHYKEGSYWNDKFPEMLKKKCVCIGWARGHDLNKLYGKPESEIVRYLKKKHENVRSYSNLKMFLNLKPGDLVAIKKTARPIEIRAYAVVVKRNGQIYKYDPNGLGHIINIEFLETSISKKYPHIYPHAIHHLGLDKEEVITDIFGPYSYDLETKRSKKIHILQGIQNKNTNKQHRKGSAPYIADAVHNKLQQDIYNYLCHRYGKKRVIMEQNKVVDITLQKGKETTFYEIKRYSTARQCIREALGQLIDYSYYVPPSNKNLKLAIVGWSNPEDEEKKFIYYLKNNLRLPINYFWWKKGKLCHLQ